MYIIEVPFMDLDKIYRSGQSLRWIKITDGKYIIPYKNKAVKVEQKKQRFIFDCSENDFFEIWWNYFDMCNDYSAFFNTIRQMDDMVKIAANRAKGVHVLKQDFFESLITSVIRLKLSGFYDVEGIIDTLTRKTGVKHVQSMGDAGKVTWFEFPEPEKLLKKQNCITNEDLGGLKDLIIDLCKCIVEGWIDADAVKGMPVNDSIHYLMDYVDSDIAIDTVSNLGAMSIFPMDNYWVITWAKMHGFNDLREFSEWYFDEEGKERLKDISLLFYYFLKYDAEFPADKLESWMVE